MKGRGEYKSALRKTAISAAFLALGIVLPFLTGQIKEIGDSLLPMHLPVMLCGAVCGGRYGFAVGALLPFIRALMLGMPPLYPHAVWMSAELATYGFVIVFLYSRFQKRGIWWLYCSLLISMISGRIVWGIAKTILLGLSGKVFTIEAFIVGGLLDSIPGIILQIVFVPLIIKLIEKYK